MKYVYIFAILLIAAIAFADDEKDRRLKESELLIKTVREFLADKRMTIYNAKKILRMRAKIAILLALNESIRLTPKGEQLNRLYEKLSKREEELLDDMANFDNAMATDDNRRKRLLFEGHQLIKDAQQFLRKSHDLKKK